MHATNDQFSDKFNNGWKKSKWLIYYGDNMKSFSFILLKFVMRVTDKQFSDKFDNG